MFFKIAQKVTYNLGNFCKKVWHQELSKITRSGHTGRYNITKSMTKTHSRMELFSRRRWTTGLAQQSNMYGIMPCMWCLIFGVWHKHKSFPLGLMLPLSPTTKELHDSTFPAASNLNKISMRCTNKNGRHVVHVFNGDFDFARRKRWVWSTWMDKQKLYLLGSGFGSVGKAVTSDTRGPRFESSHWRIII